MIKEYIGFIRNYLELAELKAKYLLINILSALFYKGFLLLMPLLASYIVKYLSLADATKTYLFLVLFSIVYFLYYLALFVNYRVYAFNMNYACDKMQSKILKKIISVDKNFTETISKGRLMNSVNADVFDVGDMNDRISEAFTGLLQIIGVLVIVAFFNVGIMLILLAFVLLRIITMNLADRKTAFYHNKTIIQDDKYSNLLTQTMAGLQEVKTFNMLPKLLDKLKFIQRRHNAQYRVRRRWLTLRDNDGDVLIYVFRFLLYVILIALMAKGDMAINELILIVAYHEYLVSYIDKLVASTMAIRETDISVNRINAILNYKSYERVYGSRSLDDLGGMIEFEKVSLELDGDKILQNINLKIKKNEIVAIVGEAGSGKTMMLNLLLRLISPSKGKISLDDIDIKEFTKEVYASNVSVANQKPFIFNMSIRKNLDFVDKNIENQIAACKRAGIHDFIETLPQGYNTILRENGNNVSGGQKQMISIARTILSDAEVLLLDDITTALDPDTAKLVPRLVKDFKKNERTVIMATKKPELMKLAEKIVLLDAGKIAEIGSHSRLMRSSRLYRDLQVRRSPSRLVGEIIEENSDDF